MQPGTHSKPSIISPLSIVIAVIFCLGLGITIWLSGGAVFNPGPVIAKSLPGVILGSFVSHAEFENQCALCHQPLRSEQAGLCLECHVDVDGQIRSGQGAHGVLPQARDCASCHAEHQGRDFDPVQAAIDTFDHNQTRLPLEGQHLVLACTDCHAGSKFDQAQPACETCHAEPPLHAGLFGLDCAVCHTSDGWKPADWNGQVFNHDSANFKLIRHAQSYSGEVLECTHCHTKAAADSFDGRACVACHASHDLDFMETHQAQFGPNCMVCHDGIDRLHDFDHQAVFLLDGRHAALSCDVCHQNQSFRGTPSECSACHGEPEIHAGSFGVQCQYCHTTESWQPAFLRLHTFPIDHGGQGEVECQTCHAGTYPQITCAGCHEHDLNAVESQHASLKLSEQQLADCLTCHADGQTHR